MTIQQLTDNWQAFVDNMNSKGIPIPMARDPKTGVGSLTTSLVVFSAGLCGLAIIFMLSTSVAKLTTNFTLNSETALQIKQAFDSSFQFLIVALSAYLGRKFQRDSKGELTTEGKSEGDSGPNT